MNGVHLEPSFQLSTGVSAFNFFYGKCAIVLTAKQMEVVHYDLIKRPTNLTKINWFTMRNTIVIAMKTGATVSHVRSTIVFKKNCIKIAHIKI